MPITVCSSHTHTKTHTHIVKVKATHPLAGCAMRRKWGEALTEAASTLPVKCEEGV